MSGKIKILLSVATLTFALLLPKYALSQSKIVSPNYEIQFPNFNSGAGVPTSTNFKTSGTLGQTAAGLFSSTNYKVKSGFQYIKTIIPFSFSISNISVNFGILTPGTPETRTATLTVKAGGAGGYSVKARENHPLQIVGSATYIPNTTCDAGTCTKNQAQAWVLNSTYGFGFNMSGDDIPSDFINSNYFRPFANAQASEEAVTIMGKNQVTWDYPNNAWPWESEATITYKVNVSGTQPAGTYTSIVKFTAIPAF